MRCVVVRDYVKKVKVRISHNHNKSMSKLHEIAQQRRLDVSLSKSLVPLSILLSRSSRLESEFGPPLDLGERLSSEPFLPKARMHVAAEFKRASPSKGAMAPEDADVEAQVGTYVRAGASVVSVLTEPKWFKGSLEDMEKARRTIQGLCVESGDGYKGRPLVLRKDFLVDEYQLYEARAYGADTVLLIVAILSDQELVHLITECRRLGMEPLVEAANEGETVRALKAGAKVLGINNRDLTTFTVDLFTTNRCAALIPKDSGVGLLALSGMKSREDVVRYENLDVVRGVLIGEHLMRCVDPIHEIRALVVDDINSDSRKTLVKICGIVRAQDAIAAAQAKVDFIGMIFAEKSPRKVSKEEAKSVVEAIRSFRENKNAIHIDLPKINISSPSKKIKQDWFVECGMIIEKACKRGPLLVGVFQDQSIEFVNDTIREIGLDLVQLHGSESWEMCCQCIVPVIKVVHVEVGRESSSEEGHDVVSGTAALILLDTTVKGGTASGGTGVSFDWAIAESYAKRGIPVIVAGGLTAENVKRAVTASGKPFAVDCSSGVQPDDKTPREKSSELIATFVKNAKGFL